eukprot:TRINITY_DN18077_c0_g1_i1.p1 TRINITY_DN18077_c0_g1~~TRINITY_DN18077_c0_g1_i1.p1  ORF type:complete len:148 (-),score=43.40 TRINITY_DN18077_c0_g1_i1:510-953(-)
MLGLMVSKESLIYSYVFTFAILLAIMTNVCHYFYVHRPNKPDWWGRWAPLLLVSTAALLMLVSPLKNLVVNLCMQSFRTNGFDSTIEHALDAAYMPMFSTVCMQVYTGVAYVLMFWGTALQVDVVGKFQSGLKEKKEDNFDSCPDGS